MSIFELALTQLRAQRKELRRLTHNLHEAQWDYQPYKHLNSIRTTLIHLLIVDRAAIVKMEDPMNFQWDALVTEEERQSSPAKLLDLLDESLTNVEDHYRQTYQALPLDTSVHLFGSDITVLGALFTLAAEYGYHNGQVSFLRQASDTSWEYYTAD